MRLIDADELKKAFDFDDDVELECAVVQFGIDNAPTVDPVTHGHWIDTPGTDDKGNHLYMCSVCGVGDIHHPIAQVNYCWKCGSKMDESIMGQVNEVTE